MKCSKCQHENPENTRFCGDCGEALVPSDGASLTKTLITPKNSLKEGSTVGGRYTIIEELGRGGMGVVYKAKDTKLKRTVALKFLPSELTHIPEVKTRFMHEAQAAAALDHPNICTVHEFEQADESSFISMAYIEGQSIREKLEAGPLGLEEAMRIAEQVAEGLQAAHQKGIVHRDIKSANIMVTERGQAKIMDFGLARTAEKTLLTKEGTTMGTIAYMSPEQARGEEVDHRTDIWSLGVVLYEMFSGQLPFKGERDQSVVYSILNEKPKPVSDLRSEIPMSIAQVVSKALEKNPEERYQHVEELLDDLKSISAGIVPDEIKTRLRKAKLLRRKKAVLYAAAAGLVIIAAVIALSLFTGPAEAIDSIAVLPLENLTGDVEKDYFVDGITDELIGQLGQISGLRRVISRTSIMKYKDTDKSLSEIARELNVDAVVEGSVQQVGDTVRIRVKLIDALPEEQNLWGQTYERPMTEVLAMYNEVARAIVNEVQITLTPNEETRLASALQVNPQAYDAYLKGIYLLEDLDLESLNKAREYLNSAIEKDPDWAPLYSSLAQVWMSLAQMNFESPEITGPKTIENLNKALELDPNNADVHFTNGMIAFLIEWDWEKAEMELLKALAANPNDAMSRVMYAHLLACLQRPGESLTQGRLAIELDPLNPMVQVWYGSVLLNIGDFNTALAYGEKITAGDPGHLMANNLIMFAAFYCRDYNKVMEATKYVLAHTGVDFKEVERIYGETGFVAAYEEILRQLEVLAQKGYVQPVELALRYMMVDQPDKAMEWIEKAFELRDPVMPYLATPGFLCEPLFDNPRFIEIIQKMNLPFD